MNDTDCIYISAKANTPFVSYGGTTATDAQVSGDMLRCTGAPSDGISVTAWRNATGNGNLAVTCAYTVSDGSVTDVDIAINSKSTIVWDDVVQDGCKNINGVQGLDLEATMTHEWGHGYGLAHVSESGHANLTMSERINGTCQSSERTLGNGDLLGMRTIYGTR